MRLHTTILALVLLVAAHAAAGAYSFPGYGVSININDRGWNSITLGEQRSAESGTRLLTAVSDSVTFVLDVADSGEMGQTFTRADVERFAERYCSGNITLRSSQMGTLGGLRSFVLRVRMGGGGVDTAERNRYMVVVPANGRMYVITVTANNGAIDPGRDARVRDALAGIGFGPDAEAGDSEPFDIRTREKLARVFRSPGVVAVVVCVAIVVAMAIARRLGRRHENTREYKTVRDYLRESHMKDREP